MSLGPDLPGFNETLADSVSTMPYRGEVGNGLSTYWLDLLIYRLENWSEGSGVEQSLISGNVTELVKVNQTVIARSLYELFDDEQMLIADLLPALFAWRELVVANGANFDIPETYRRNPYPMPSGGNDASSAQWSGDDAVVMTAITIGGGRSLDRLLANIDVCNHDVPPYEVVGPALGRLVGAGVVQVRGSGFRLTRLGRKVVRGTRAATILRVAKVKDRLAAVPMGAEEAVLERADWDATITRYVDRHRRRG